VVKDVVEEIWWEIWWQMFLLRGYTTIRKKVKRILAGSYIRSQLELSM